MKVISIIIINLLVIILIYILILVPFERGRQIFEIKEQGEIIVKGINSYFTSNQTYPKKLSDLCPQYCDSINFRYNSDFFEYRNVISIDSAKSQYYYLTFTTKFLGVDYLKYDINKKNFILTDD